MERFFNTAGPQTPESYTIDPLSRFDLDDILMLIRQKRYFVLHAPRQTGKTSCMLALRDYLNKQDDYIAVYANIEGGQAKRNDVDGVIRGTCDKVAGEFRRVLKSDMPMQLRDEARKADASSMLSTLLARLSETLPKPIVLILDEIDALVGDSLVSILRQIRSGYADRPAAFPQTVILCGVRDVRDHRIVLSNQEYMFSYHSKLVAEHPYASVWYQWVLNIRPILYYLQYFDDGTRSSFGAFLNPMLCWGGLLALFVLFYRAVFRRDGDAGFILVGYLAQLLPWVLVTRLTFEYHYFPCSVFLVLGLAYVFRLMEDKADHAIFYLDAFTAVSAILFVVFYPALSGMRVDNAAASQLLGWLPTWPF